jgi:hypothetical protein
VVVGTPGSGDEASAPLIDLFKDERPRHRGGIVAEHQCPLRLDSPHDKTILGLRRLRGRCRQPRPLKLRNDPVRARDTSVIKAVVAVPAGASAPHLDKPRPDLGGWGRIVIACVHPTFASATRLVTRQRSPGLAGKRTNRTPRHHGRHDDTQEPQRIPNEPRALRSQRIPAIARRCRPKARGCDPRCPRRADSRLWTRADRPHPCVTWVEPSHSSRRTDRLFARLPPECRLRSAIGVGQGSAGVSTAASGHDAARGRQLGPWGPRSM